MHAHVILLISLHFEPCVSVMRVREREACSESGGNNLITHTLTHHARSKRSEINSTRYTCARADIALI